MVSIVSTAGHVLTHLISQGHEVETITPLSLHIRKLVTRRLIIFTTVTLPGSM